MSIDARKIRLLMQLRREGITDSDVLSALEKVPREKFIPDSFRDKAYDNTALPIANGQTISQPFIVAYMTQALKIGERDTVLEIGTGSGYQAAILSHLARRVYTIERHKSLQEDAIAVFEDLKLRNITHRHGDGYKGWPEAAPFDRIIVTASAPGDLPEPLLEQLSEEGGVMVIPVKKDAIREKLVRVTKNGDEIKQEELLDVRFVPLVSQKAGNLQSSESEEE